MRRPDIDLTKTAWVKPHGDITVYGTWWFGGASGPRPCLALLPTNARRYESSMVAVVTIDHAWIWSETIGDPRQAARNAADFASVLGLPPEPSSALRVLSIIRDHITDLLLIKPYEAYSNDFETVAEATVRGPDGKVRQAEIRERI